VSVAATFSAKQRTRALELVKAQRYAELANEGPDRGADARDAMGRHGLIVRRARSRCARYRIVIAEYEEYLTDDVSKPGIP